MELMEIIKKRYSTKNFDPTKALTVEQIAKIENLLRFAPSSTNVQPWHFIMATTENGKKRISKCCQGFYAFNEQKVLDAGVVIVFAAKSCISNTYLDLVLEKESQDGRFPSPEFKEQNHAGRSIFVNLHKYEFKDLQHWTAKQVYLNIGYFLFGVAQMGLDSLTMEGFDLKALDDEFKLWDKDLNAVAVVSVGYAKEDDFNKHLPKSRLDLDVILQKI